MNGIGFAGMELGSAISSDNGNQLRSLAKTDEREALIQATRQFESMFINMMLKSMRKSVSESSLLDNQTTNMFRDMHDTELSQKLASGGGLGLTDQVVGQLLRREGFEATDTLTHLQNRPLSQK